MALFPLIILALVQGITEFLPISSSGHLVLVHAIFDETKSWKNHMALNVAVHVGTLFSVLLYFRRDVIKMLCGFLACTKGNFKNQGMKLNAYILLASLPVILAGLGLHILKPSWLLALEIMAWSTLVFGVLLWIADRLKPTEKTLESMSAKDALLIGCAQALALVPGTSRSGVTMTAARFLGYSRPESAHFSLLLAIIAIAGAGTLGSIELWQSGNSTLGLDALIAALIAFIAGWLSIAAMMKWLEKCSFTPFAFYRIILGVILLAYIYA